MTYAELVTRLRKRAKELPERFPKNEENIRLFLAAANAIEELSREYESVSKDLVDSVELCRKLKKPKWIPVTEQLPEEHSIVLLYSYGDVVVGTYDSEYKEFRELNGFQRLCTHWMPRPKPPKEET